nr:tyrosine-type recombinase/integrase [Salinispora vitiensis]
MSTRGLNMAFQSVVLAAGIPHASTYTFHSLRVGGASELRRRGATIEGIADAGRWSRHSTIVMDYLRAAERWIDHPMQKVGAYAVTEYLAAVLGREGAGR